MPLFCRNYKLDQRDKPHIGYERFCQGMSLIYKHPLFGRMGGTIHSKKKYLYGKDSIACVSASGEIYINYDYNE